MDFFHNKKIEITALLLMLNCSFLPENLCKYTVQDAVVFLLFNTRNQHTFLRHMHVHVNVHVYVNVYVNVCVCKCICECACTCTCESLIIIQTFIVLLQMFGQDYLNNLLKQ